jgi:hypothetical protein
VIEAGDGELLKEFLDGCDSLRYIQTPKVHVADDSSTGKKSPFPSPTRPPSFVYPPDFSTPTNYPSYPSTSTDDDDDDDDDEWLKEFRELLPKTPTIKVRADAPTMKKPTLIMGNRSGGAGRT